MSEVTTIIALASVGTITVTIAAAAALRGWEDWLDLRRLELGGIRPGPARTAARPDLTELRARVRRLEAIANGSES
jgi:hypothetical protein